MKKPYIKKYGDVAGFSVWIVDGKYIRDNIDEEFTNYGQHYQFKCIPKEEFWIDKEHGQHSEAEFYIDSMLTLNRLLAGGLSHDEAVKIADERERKERKKSNFFKKNLGKIPKKKDGIEKIHMKVLRKYRKGKLKVWLVNGELVRDLFFIDFTEGGHDKVYNFVPKNEIWIDDDVSQKERKFVLLHEVHERNLMKEGLDYNTAHHFSSRIEHRYRKHPKELDKKLQEELKKSAEYIS